MSRGDGWKKAVINYIIYKKEDKMEYNNYRGPSMLCLQDENAE